MNRNRLRTWQHRYSLAPLYRELVEEGSLNFTGLSILQHAKYIGSLITRHDAKTAIDVGCGKGDQYSEPYELAVHWGLESIYKYDPAFPTHDALPEVGTRFDAVLCSDVLEHVPEHEVEFFIRDLFALSNKFVWASVCCRPAKKFFPKSDYAVNMHVTVRSFQWWHDQFDHVRNQTDLFSGEHNNRMQFYLTETE